MLSRDAAALRWRHNGRDSVSNHQPHDCLLKRLFRRRSKKTSKLRVTGLCAANSPATGELPAQMASNAENVSIWWRHHGAPVMSALPRSVKPLDAIFPFEVLWYCLDLKLCSFLQICPFASHRLAHGPQTCPWAKNLAPVWSRHCGTHISKTTRQIYTIHSYMELSRPVIVQRHINLSICAMGLPMGQKRVKSGTTGVQICGTILQVLCCPSHPGLILGLRPANEIRTLTSPMTLTLNFHDQIKKKSCISGMGGSINMDRKGCESIGRWTHYVTLSYDLDHGFSRLIFEKLYPCSGVADWHGTKCMWVNRKSVPLCDFELWSHPWPWPWIFKVNFKKNMLYLRNFNGRVDWHGKKWVSVSKTLNPVCGLEIWFWSLTFKVKLWNRRIPRMGGPTDMEQMGCKSIGCWTYCVT